ncbi:MAG: phosphate ABC transporter permease PstA [Magnetococcus sp. DMHC-1]|nr:phosphate ABC transporter permease PstA [Magnetococcales bacterium]
MDLKDPIVQKRLQRRHAANRRFRWYGLAGLTLALSALVFLLGAMVFNGISALRQARVLLTVHFDPAQVDPEGNHAPASLAKGNYDALVRQALKNLFPDVTVRADIRRLKDLVSVGAAFKLQEMLQQDPTLLGKTLDIWVPVTDKVDMWLKNKVPHNLPESERHIKDKEVAWIDFLVARSRLQIKFNDQFFTHGDSREPELAGIRGAIQGSLLTILVTFIISFPLGVATAVYLEEFARKGRWADFIEVNINNLAAVPSIVFGLLGLALYLNTMHLPRSVPLVGGLTLAMMTLPTMVIATRSALRSVPQPLRDAARALGASPLQVVMHHVLPLALPGMLTGTIIAMAQSLGETAPLLMIGMVAFIMEVPNSVLDPSAVMPVQIFLWADSPERGFLEKTAGATLVLLCFLITMNALAVYLRNRFEKRW